MKKRGCNLKEISPHAMAGSWICALISLLLLVLAINCDPAEFMELIPKLWPPTLMIIWLLFATWLISREHKEASTFQKYALKMIGQRGGSAIWEHQTMWLRA